MRSGFVLAAAILAAGSYVLYRRSVDAQAPLLESIETATNDAAQGAAELLDSFTGGAMRISAMANVSAVSLQNQNVQAFLRVIRRGEGTTDENGYKRIFGGELFDGFADHPRKVVTRNRLSSSAAGAYQFLASSWDETRRVMKLPDFTPRSQDLGAVGRIAARGALADVIAGRFAEAVRKCAREWASLPGSPYGQPTISMATAASVFSEFGGIVSA